MAGMGKTGSVNISPEMMTEAVKAIQNYRTTTDQLYKNVNSSVTGLLSADFTGSAATGFSNFYTNNIEPVTGESLTGMLDTLEQICNSIREAIPDTEGVDEQLGTANNQ